MRYAQIRKCDIANGAGIRTSLFIQGCSRHCEGCFNPETWDFDGGYEWTAALENILLELTGQPHIAGVTILGGEPMEPGHRQEVANLVKKLKQRYPQKTIWLYSSYTFEVLKKDQAEALQYIDVLVDGPFIEAQKDLSLRFRGSSNQRLIDVVKSLKKEKIILYR